VIESLAITRPRPYVAAIIQAREGSGRLPGKVHRKIGGKSILEHVISNVQEAKTVHAVVVASPDKRISDIASSRGAFDFWYRGDPNDVLDRYVKAAEWVNCDIIVRITADCPLIDPAVIDLCVEGLRSNDICSNVLRRRFPVGMDVEVFHRDSLYRMERMAVDNPFWKEHVTYGVYEQPNLWLHKNIDAVKDYSWVKVAVDTEDELDFVRSVYASIKPGDGYQDIAEAVSEHFRAFVAAGSPGVRNSTFNGHPARRAPEKARRV
jgi:spore coat polysaccharide biosynthesis protein SpsF